MSKILIIDDDLDICLLLERFFTKKNFLVKHVNTGKRALQELTDFNPDIILCDFRLDDTNGKQLLQQIKLVNAQVPVIIITGYSDIKMAVDVMKHGAYDYVTKPLFPEEILLTVTNALGGKTGTSYISSANRPVSLTQDEKGRAKNETQFIFSESAEFSHVLKQIELVAPTNYSVMIYGESGSGKEAVALEIHRKSLRAKAPFVAIDCGTLTRELAASELFGHEKGSFTGAINQKIGSLESANGGTIFLDEVSNLSYEVQISLLRVVQERKIRRVGGNRDIDIDIRIIVASNEKLWEITRQGKFREDLFHRFNEFSINLPPLRNRKSDIIKFGQFFLEQTNQELGKNIIGFRPEVMQLFQSYHWPGNLREYKNVIKRAALLESESLINMYVLPFELVNHQKLSFEVSPVEENIHNHENTEFKILQQTIIDTTMQQEELPIEENIEPSFKFNGNEYSLKAVSIGAEYEMIIEALKNANYNKSKAAKLLNIDRKTLYNKMKQYKEFTSQ